MDINELNQWLATEEGTKWGVEFKRPLLDKRTEILAALKEANGKLAESEQRSAAAAKELSQERAVLSTLLVDKELARILTEKRVMESALPGTVAELKDSYGITVKADGLSRETIGKIKGADGTEQEASLEEVASAWAATPAAKQVILNTNTGGGAPGSAGRAHTANSLSRLSGPALAKLSDSEFHAMRQSAIAQGE
jgi:hypothetical protein